MDNVVIGQLGNGYAVGSQNTSGATHTFRLDHCTVDDYFIAGLDATSSDIDFVVNNSFFPTYISSFPLGFIAVFHNFTLGACTLSGSYCGASNASGDIPNTGPNEPSGFPKEIYTGTNWVSDSMLTTPTSTSQGFFITADASLTGTDRFAADFRPLRYTGGLTFTGTNHFFNSNVTNYVGSEPDSRQDFSLDARGCKRLSTGAPDIGAFQTTDTLDQSRFRWRNDDGSETSATWAAAENANITEDAGVTKRLRVQVDVDSGYPDITEPYRLQFRTGAGAWRDVPLT
jgi:hypothetical protein